MAIPENIRTLANKVRTAIYGKDVRESIAESMEKTSDVADKATEVSQQLINGSFDEGLLNTEIEQRLDSLETQYTPRLSAAEQKIDDNHDEVTAQLAQRATKVDSVAVITFYVSPTGSDNNDGATLSTPFGTLQKAFDHIKSIYSVIDGKIKIDLAEGVYEQSAKIIGITSKERIEIVGKKDINGIPTVIFSGLNNQELPYAISFQNYMNVIIKDLKVQDFANSASRSGIVAQNYTNIWTVNVHATNCGFAGINCDSFTRLYVEGGLITGNRIGIRAYSNSIITIGYNNPSQSYADPNRTIINNNTETGLLVYNMSTGHLDYCELDGNRVAVTVQNSSRMHLMRNLIKNSTLFGVHVTSSSTWYNNQNTYENNARDYKESGYSTELSESERYTPLMRIEPSFFSGQVSHTGNTNETNFNTINPTLKHVLKGRSFVTAGQKIKIIVSGQYAGAGTKTIRVRMGASLIAEFSSALADTSKYFYINCDLYAINETKYKMVFYVIDGNSAYNVVVSERTAGLTGDLDITVTGQLSNSAGSIKIESFEVREVA